MDQSTIQFQDNFPIRYLTQPENNFYQSFLTNFLQSELGLGVNCLWVVELSIPVGGQDMLAKQFKMFYHNGVDSENYGAMLNEAMRLFSDKSSTVMDSNPFWLASAISINGESLNSARPQTPESFNGIVPYIGAKRADLPELTIQTFMTDQSFADVVVRPWMSAIFRYGMKLDTFRSFIKCKLFTRKRRVFTTIFTPNDWMCKLSYTFSGVFPKQVPSLEYNYSGADTLKAVTLTFGFDRYSIDVDSNPIEFLYDTYGATGYIQPFNETYITSGSRVSGDDSPLSARPVNNASIWKRIGQGVAANLDTTYIMLTPLLAIRNTDKDDTPTYSEDSNVKFIPKGDTPSGKVKYDHVKIKDDDFVTGVHRSTYLEKVDEDDTPDYNLVYGIGRQINENDTPEGYEIRDVQISEGDTPVGVDVKFDGVSIPLNDVPLQSIQGQTGLKIPENDFPIAIGAVGKPIQISNSDARSSGGDIEFNRVAMEEEDVPNGQSVVLQTISTDDHAKGTNAAMKNVAIKSDDYVGKELTVLTKIVTIPTDDRVG